MITNPTFARTMGIHPQSIVAHLCRHGSYFGIKPFKLPNGRLMWPDDAIEQLAKKGAAK